jgi:hypothetical protein
MQSDGATAPCRSKLKAFRAAPEWVKVKATTEANGALVEKHESTFMTLTDFSPIL